MWGVAIEMCGASVCLDEEEDEEGYLKTVLNLNL